MFFDLIFYIIFVMNEIFFSFFVYVLIWYEVFCLCGFFFRVVGFI